MNLSQLSSWFVYTCHSVCSSALPSGWHYHILVNNSKSLMWVSLIQIHIYIFVTAHLRIIFVPTYVEVYFRILCSIMVFFSETVLNNMWKVDCKNHQMHLQCLVENLKQRFLDDICFQPKELSQMCSKTDQYE